RNTRPRVLQGARGVRAVHGSLAVGRDPRPGRAAHRARRRQVLTTVSITALPAGRPAAITLGLRGPPGARGLRPPPACGVALAAIALIGLVAAFATATHRELVVFGLSAGGILFFVGLKRPEIPLAVLVILIPVEQWFVIDSSVGTLSRYVDILFVATYVLP